MGLSHSPKIKTDLLEIIEYIARDNIDRAYSFAEELRAEMKKIAKNPQGYQERPDLGPGMRSAAYGRYLIVFRIENNVVRFRRVVHGARSLKKLAL